MKKAQSVFLLFLIILLPGCASTPPPPANLFGQAKKTLLATEGTAEFIAWEWKNEASLWSEDIGEVDALAMYRDSLELALGPQQYAAQVAKESSQEAAATLLEGEDNGDRINAGLVHTGKVGNIRPINYLEAQILNYQMGRYPMFSHPTEFHAFLLQDAATENIRVYFGASDAPWPPRPTVLVAAVEKDMEEGWTLIGHLHNHYCSEADNYLGILAPSLADAQYFKMLKERFNVGQTLITNGVHTVEIAPKDFTVFASH